MCSFYSAMTPGPFLNSSLPRPFCRLNPDPRSGAGPLGCRVGNRSWLALSPLRLTVRLLPIGAGAGYDCESSPHDEKTFLCRRGLEELPCPFPRDMLPSPLTRKLSSRPKPRPALEVGVNEGVFDPTVLSCCSRAPFVCRPAGKLEVDAAGEGVKVRRSANDFAALRLAAFPDEFEESKTPSRPTDDCPRSVLKAALSDWRASLKSVVAERFRPLRRSLLWKVPDREELGGLMLGPVAVLCTCTWRCSPFPREECIRPIECAKVWTISRSSGVKDAGNMKISRLLSLLNMASSV